MFQKMICLSFLMTLISNPSFAKNKNLTICEEACLSGYRKSVTKLVMDSGLSGPDSVITRKLLRLSVDKCGESCAKAYNVNKCNQ